MNEFLPAVNTAVYFFCSALYFLEGFFFYRVLCCIVRRREGRFWAAAVFLSCAALSSMIIFPNDLFNVTLDLIWFTAMMLLAFRGSLWQRLAAVVIFYPLIISQNFLVMDLLGNLLLLLGDPPFLNPLFSIADTAIHLALWYLILRLMEKRLSSISRLFDDRTWILLDVICLASLVNITTCIYFSPEESYKIWPATLACFVTNLGSLFLAEYFMISIQRDMERKNLKLRKSYYEELEQNQSRIRKLRHDMNNHFSVIRSLVHSGNQTEAEQYLEKLEERITADSRIFCQNSIINAVLNAKYNLAVEHEIDCFFHIGLKKLLSIDAISLCCLFANTLDNAVEASLKISDPQDRHISVKARVTENGYFSYEIVNAKNNAVLKKNGTFCSDKTDRASHGFGLANVREVVERYSGTLDISYTEDTFSVTVLIRNA